jgi:molecular chaperone GrpE
MAEPALPKKEEQKKLAKEEEHKLVGEHAHLKELTQEGHKEIAEGKHKEIAGEKHSALANAHTPEARINELEEIVKRLQAEFDNYRKRTATENAKRAEDGKMEFAKEMLHFADEFENALSHLKGEEKKGVEMIYRSFVKTLDNQGVREMNCAGQKYDPYLHDALKSEESGKPEGTIIGVVKKGYYFRDMVLRHAAVIVSGKKGEKSKEEHESGKEGEKTEEDLPECSTGE